MAKDRHTESCGDAKSRAHGERVSESAACPRRARSIVVFTRVELWWPLQTCLSVPNSTPSGSQYLQRLEVSSLDVSAMTFLPPACRLLREVEGDFLFPTLASCSTMSGEKMYLPSTTFLIIPALQMISVSSRQSCPRRPSRRPWVLASTTRTKSAWSHRSSSSVSGRLALSERSDG